MATAINLTHDHILWVEKSKEELIEEILRLRKQVDTLEQENTSLKEQLKPAKAQAVGKLKRRKRWKKLGRPVGHVGCTRRKPDVIHHTVHQTLDECPDCGKKNLSELPTETEEHIQEDIVPAHVEATQFIRHVYWCPNCKERKTAPYHCEEVPYGYLGPNVLTQTLLLKYRQGLPYAKIKELFSELCGLTVTRSALAQALQRMSKWLKVEEDLILKAIRASAWHHGDETGWKIAGLLHYLWAFVNNQWAIYRIRRSRGRKIPEEIMGEKYAGIGIHDFLSAYDKTGKRRQRCHVHLLREMRELKEKDGSPEYLSAYKKLKRILSDAHRLNDRRSKLSPWTFFRRTERLKERLLQFACQPFTNGNWKRLSKRLLKYYEEIFTFLDVPGLPWHNNLAERMIRPNVIFRKISFQNMSPKGAEAHEVLMSILQTLRLQDKNTFAFLKLAYLKHRQGNTAPLLGI